MSEGVMAVVKSEMKSYIWIQTADGSIQQVEEEVAMFCPMICREILQTGMGSSKNYAISLPQRVNPAIFGLILDYCRFHQVPGRSNKERKIFDEKFIRMDTKRLCELTSAADSLQLKPLVDLTSRALARIIEGKTPEEIRETFHLPDDLTEEEKLEPLKNITDDPRIRLLNRLYARKRKELKERGKLKNVEVEEELVDERSVDDLLSFINGGNGESKGVKTNKNKKKNRRQKDQLKDSSSNNLNGNHKEFNSLPPARCNGELNDIKLSIPNKASKLQGSTAVTLSPKLEFDDGDIDDDLDPTMKEKLHRLAIHLQYSGQEFNSLPSACCNGELSDITLSIPNKASKLQGSTAVTLSPKLEFEDGDIDDDLDPAMKEELDREVEDFARRLNSDWPQRMQEILSLGQERRLVSVSLNGNGSARRCTSLDSR